MARSAAGDCADQLRTATDGSQHDAPAAALASIAEGIDHTDQALVWLESVLEQLTVYISILCPAALTVSVPMAAPPRQAPSTRPTNPLDIEAQDRWAERAYEEFRHDGRDIDAIVESHRGTHRPDGTNGYTRQEIADVKNHLMRRAHPLEDPESGQITHRRFDPLADIAAAWVRLRSGRSQDADLLLLEHELLEITYWRNNPRASYREAHAHANSRYNWENSMAAVTREDLDQPWGH